MSRRARALLFLAGAAGFAVLLVTAYAGLPRFGTDRHPYGARAVHAALDLRHTANVVASVSFDQRGTDTLGEEAILFAAALGAALLLRRSEEEREQESESEHEGTQQVPPLLAAVRLAGYVMLPVTLVVGGYVVAHGHLSPGGGFQGGVVLASALHLVYLAGDYPALDRLRPVPLFHIVEAVGILAFTLVGVAGLLFSSGFLANGLGPGQLGNLLSAGTVPILNVAAGIAVGSAIVTLLAEFLDQALVIRPRGSR